MKTKSLNFLLPWFNDQINEDLGRYEFTGWSQFNSQENREEFFLIHVKSGIMMRTWKWHD